MRKRDSPLDYVVATKPCRWNAHLWKTKGRDKTGGESTTFPHPGSLTLRIGALSIAIRRDPMEWGLTYERVALEDPSLDHSWEVLEGDVGPGQSARFVMEQTPGTPSTSPPHLRIVPSLPHLRFHCTCHRKKRRFSLWARPLWLRMTPEGAVAAWPEIPIKRPTDTWVGGSTLDGDLCYAVQTQAVLNPEHLILSARRAITPVLIHNHTADLFQVERLKIPVEHLCLYADPKGGLWTEQICCHQLGRCRPGPDQD